MGVTDADVAYEEYVMEVEREERERIQGIFAKYPFIDDCDPEYDKISHAKDLLDPISIDDDRSIRKILNKYFKVNAKEHYFNKHVSDCTDIVTNILTDHHNYDIIAKTGAGKTSAILNKALELSHGSDGYKMIFLVPLQVNAKYLESKEDYHGQLRSIYEKVNQNEVDDIIQKHSVIVSTYDGLQKILSTKIDVNWKEYVLVIDEVHNFVIQTNFRKTVLRYVTDHIQDFKKVIRLTGTPEGVLMDQSNYHRIRFIKRNNPNNLIKRKYTLFTYNKSKDQSSLKLLVDHIMQRNYTGKVVALINDTEFIYSVQKLLIDKGISEKKIAVLHRKNKSTKAYETIATQGEIPAEYDFVLSTSVINDGIDINNSDIQAVYFYNIYNPIVFRQFMARFRKGFDYCYDFIPNLYKTQIVLPNIKTRFNKYIKFFKFVVNQLNVLIDFEQVTDDEEAIKMMEEILGVEYQELCPIYYCEQKKSLAIDEQVLKYKTLFELNQAMMGYSKVRKTYLELFEDITADIEEDFEFKGDISDNDRSKICRYCLEVLGIDPAIIKKIGSMNLKYQYRYLKRVLEIKKNHPKIVDIIHQIDSLGFGDFIKNIDIIKGELNNTHVFDPKKIYDRLKVELAGNITQRELTEDIGNIYHLCKHTGNKWKIKSKWTVQTALNDIIRRGSHKRRK